MNSKRFLAMEGSTGVLGFCAPILTEADLKPEPAFGTSDGEFSRWPLVTRDRAAVLRSLCGRVSVAQGDANRNMFTCACNVFHTSTIKRVPEKSFNSDGVLAMFRRNDKQSILQSWMMNMPCQHSMLATLGAADIGSKTIAIRLRVLCCYI